jgi:hypothetical protein
MSGADSSTAACAVAVSATIRLDTLDGTFAKIPLEALQYSDWLTMQVDDLDRDGKGKQSLVLHAVDDATLLPLASFLDASFRESKDAASEAFFAQARQVLQQRQTYTSLTAPIPIWTRKWLHQHCHELDLPATISDDLPPPPPESSARGTSTGTGTSTSTSTSASAVGSARRSKASASAADEEQLRMQLQALVHWSEMSVAFGVQRLHDAVIVALCHVCKQTHALGELLNQLS